MERKIGLIMVIAVALISDIFASSANDINDIQSERHDAPSVNCGYGLATTAPTTCKNGLNGAKGDKGDKGEKGERGDNGYCAADKCGSVSNIKDALMNEVRQEMKKMRGEMEHPFCSSLDNTDEICGPRCTCADAPNKDRYVCDCTRQRPRFDCTEHRMYSNVSGLYKLKILNKVVTAFCEMVGNDGWTVIQRRQDGSQEFYQGWQKYRNGFGDPRTEYWLGLENIYLLTNNHHNKIRFDMQRIDGAKYYAEYSTLRFNDERSFYKLTNVGTYSGNATDQLSRSVGFGFSTWDNDNDGWGSKGKIDTNSAAIARGAFWYYSSGYYSHINPNGEYFKTGNVGSKTYKGIHWNGVTDTYKSLIRMSIKIKRTVLLSKTKKKET